MKDSGLKPIKTFIENVEVDEDHSCLKYPITLPVYYYTSMASNLTLISDVTETLDPSLTNEDISENSLYSQDIRTVPTPKLTTLLDEESDGTFSVISNIGVNSQLPVGNITETSIAESDESPNCLCVDDGKITESSTPDRKSAETSSCSCIPNKDLTERKQNTNSNYIFTDDENNHECISSEKLNDNFVKEEDSIDPPIKNICDMRVTIDQFSRISNCKTSVEELQRMNSNTRTIENNSLIVSCLFAGTNNSLDQKRSFNKHNNVFYGDSQDREIFYIDNQLIHHSNSSRKSTEESPPPSYKSLREWILQDSPPNYETATGKKVQIEEV